MTEVIAGLVDGVRIGVGALAREAVPLVLALGLILTVRS